MKTIPKVSAFNRWKRLPQNLISPIPFLLDQKQKLGDIYLFPMGFAKVLILSTPEYSKHILQKNHKNYFKSKIQSEMLANFIGKGLLTSNGNFWLKQRRLIQPSFHKKKLESITNLMLSEINAFSEKLEKLSKENDTIDFHPLMTDLTFDIIAKSIFSERLKKSELDLLKETVSVIQNYFIKCLRLPFLVWLFKLLGIHKRRFETVEKSDSIILNEIKNRIANKVEKSDLLDMLINSRYEDTNEPMSNEQIKDEVNIIFSAGHETSANTLSWAFYLLAKHKNIYEKVRKESFEILGDLNKNKATFEKANQLKYTKQVINEVLRMYPPAWLIDRTPLQDDEIDGYKIPKGQIVFTHVYGIHHDERYWELPNKFNPERFSDEKKKQINNFQFFPFGGGPRLCVGNNFAMLEMQLIIATIAQKFDLDYLQKKEPEQTALVTLQPRFGIKLKVKSLQ